MSKTKDDNKNDITSHLIKSRVTAYAAVSAALALLYMLPAFSYLAVIPFVVLVFKGFHTTALKASFVCFIYGGYLLILFSPLFLIKKELVFLGLYAPLVFISMKDGKNELSYSKVIPQVLLWEIPLFLWIYASNFLGFRALEPFYSDITEDIVVGSVPLNSDVKYLHDQGVTAVVNMCWEYAGPVDSYKGCGIEQLHLPTLDIAEPHVSDMVKASEFIKRTVTNNTGGKKGKVFIHCKGGRGRAVTAALCYLISTKEFKSVDDAFAVVKKARDVSASVVSTSSVVVAFAKLHSVAAISE